MTSKTITLKVMSDRMASHLESKQNTSGYIRGLIEQDMLTQAEELERKLDEIQSEQESLSAREEELESEEDQVMEQLESAREMESEVSGDIVDFVEGIITIAPDDRARNIEKTVRAEVPEVSPGEVIQAVEAIDLHFHDFDGKVRGEQFLSDFEDAGFDPDDVESSIGSIPVIDDKGSDEWEFARSLTPRERDELEEELPQYV